VTEAEGRGETKGGGREGRDLWYQAVFGSVFSHAINMGSCVASRVYKRRQQKSTAETLLFLSTSPVLTSTLAALATARAALSLSPTSSRSQRAAKPCAPPVYLPLNLSLFQLRRHATASFPYLPASTLCDETLHPLTPPLSIKLG